MPIWGHFTLQRTGDQVAPFLFDANVRIAEVVDRFAPDLVGFESPLLRGRDDPRKLRKLYGLVSEVEKVAWKRKIDCREVSLGEIRTHFLGRGYPRNSERIKIAVCNRARQLGWDVAVDDEADALAGLDFLLSIKRPGHALRVTPMFAKERA